MGYSFIISAALKLLVFSSFVPLFLVFKGTSGFEIAVFQFVIFNLVSYHFYVSASNSKRCFIHLLGNMLKDLMFEI